MRRLLIAFLLSLIGLLPAGALGTNRTHRTAHDALAPAIVHAQGEPTLVVTLYGSTLSFRTFPFALVTAELLRLDGTKAQGIGGADATGLASVNFALGNLNPGGPTGSVVRPGDTLTLSRDGQRPLKVTVPAIVAEVDVAADRVFGTGPAGAALAIGVTTDGPSGSSSITRTVSAGADGRFSLDLAGQVDLQPGGVTGQVAYDTPEGYRFIAQYAALSADVTVGSRGVRGRATPGTRVGFGIQYPDGSTYTYPPFEITGGASYALGSNNAGPPPHQVGGTVIVTATGQTGVVQSLTATVQGVTVTISSAADTVSGTGPSNTALVVTVESMGGEVERFPATTDANGGFSLDLAGRVDLGAGWRARAAYAAAPGVTVGGLAVVNKLRVGLGLQLAQGRTRPGRQVTLTLRSSAGADKAIAQTFANDRGDYYAFLQPLSGLGYVPEAGDSLELVFVDGDPVVLKVPVLTARTDVEGDAIFGEAAVGSKVRVLVDGMASSAAATADADATGNYRAKFPAGYDLVRPANGSASLLLPSGNEFYVNWAAVQLIARTGSTFSSSFVLGNGPGGRQVQVQLVAPDGKIVAESTVLAGGGGFALGPNGLVAAGSQFAVQPVDATGTPVSMRAGDKLRIVAGDETTEVPVPPLDAVVFVRQSTVSGHAAPGAQVTIRVSQNATSFDAEGQTTADGSGNFSYKFPSLALKYGDFIQLSTPVGAHTFFNLVIAPGLLLDLDQGVLLGSLAPNAKAAITLARAGATLSQIATEADASGAMFVQFSDAQGDPLVLLPGDTVAVKPEGSTVEPLNLTIPEIALSWDVAADTVRGRATPGGSLVVVADETYPRQGTLGVALAWPELLQAGTFDAEFAPSVNVRPGSRYSVLYRPPAGHYIQRTRTVPILNAEHSGPNVCGFGTVRQDIPGTLTAEGGAQLASTNPHSRFDGYFSGVWQDTAKATVVTAMSQTVTAKLETVPAAIQLPALSLAVDRQNGIVAGMGPANTTYYLNPAVPCASQNPNANGNFMSYRTSPTGAFGFGLQQFLGWPGAGVEIAMYAPNDHRYFRQIYDAFAQITIRTPNVAGLATPLSAVTLTLQTAAGVERARAATAADASGGFDVQFKDGAGTAVNIQAGDIVTLQNSGQTTPIPVEPLSFDWSKGNLVRGAAPAGRSVFLVLRLADGRYLSLNRPVNDQGTFEFTAADVPPRADWGLADLEGVRVILTTPSGHQIVDQSANFIPSLDTGTPRIYLPIAAKRHPVRAAAVQAAVKPADLVRVNVVATSIGLRPWARWFERLDGFASAPTSRDLWMHGAQGAGRVESNAFRRSQRLDFNPAANDWMTDKAEFRLESVARQESVLSPTGIFDAIRYRMESLFMDSKMMSAHRNE